MTLLGIALFAFLSGVITISTLTVMLYLLAMRVGLSNLTAYLSGLFIGGLLAGLIILLGVGQMVSLLFTHPSLILMSLKLLLAALCFFFALFPGKSKAFQNLSEPGITTLTPRYTFVAGFGLNAIQIPTNAFCLFVLGHLLHTEQGFWYDLYIWSFFVLISLLPLVLLGAIALYFPSQIDPLLHFVQKMVRKFAEPLVRTLLILLGAFLIYEAFLYK